ncbi:MAG: cupredoxin domain-containing protein [Bacteroidota bacterium]
MKLIFISSLLFLSACGSSKLFDAIPPDLDVHNIAKVTVNVTAESYKFTPEVIRVNAGTLVTLKIKSIEGTHGFQLGAFGIDERLDENELKLIEFYASKKGEYRFRCSHLCGIGHLGMTGKVIVE